MSVKSRFIGVLLAGAVTTAAPLLAQELSPEVQAGMGKATFRHYCQSCHGPEARGDGPVAQYLKPKPADLTRIRERNKGEFPSDAVYAAIAGGQPVKGHGTSEMPVWGEAFHQTHSDESDAQIEARITQLVEYLRSIQAPEKTAP